MKTRNAIISFFYCCYYDCYKNSHQFPFAQAHHFRTIKNHSTLWIKIFSNNDVVFIHFHKLSFSFCASHRNLLSFCVDLVFLSVSFKYTSPSNSYFDFVLGVLFSIYGMHSAHIKTTLQIFTWNEMTISTDSSVLIGRSMTHDKPR